MLATARTLGIAPKAPKTTEGVGRCLDHAFSELGFLDAWSLARFIDSLAERGPRQKKPPQRVRLPAWKVPEGKGVRAVVAIRCKVCSGTGRGCARCTGYGWGIVFTLRRARCGHPMAPTSTLATG
jgi:hypothetical protein